MKFEVRAEDRAYQVDVTQADNLPLQIHLSKPPAEGRQLMVEVLSRTRNRWTLCIEGQIYDVVISGRGERTSVDWSNRTWDTAVYDHRRRLLRRASGLAQDGVAVLKAQMPGKVIQVLKQEGDLVEAGEGLAVIEAMKMQNELKCPKSGTVITCRLTAGGTVDAGQVMFEIE